MKNHQEVIQYWHQIRCVHIEDVNNKDHRKDEQSTLPVFRGVVRIPNADQSLNDGSSEKGSRG